MYTNKYNSGQYTKKRPDRMHRKHAIPMGNLISDTLSRHGIGRQVQSALIVREGNNILCNLIEPQFLKDIRVLSFTYKTLTIACRHSASAHLANSIRASLQEKIEQKIPSAIIENIFVKIDPHALDHSADTLV
ncbi:DUF721 domain-containing protein [Patescibacteria group bacterium]|nr:DUF721 domain-containing protein [Patescibacteria group bacterium]MBU4452640.1 DUF721 domain-containing protein [Patescibacteria group bacterium]MCG2687685.1 DUF721 domain-containing protein [Candidatus Parcubacteria bacterium]